LWYFNLTDHGPLATYAQYHVSTLEPAFAPQTLEGGANCDRVPDLALDDSADRQAHLGKPYDLVMRAISRDLYSSYC
jgi:hypothetical protein